MLYYHLSEGALLGCGEISRGRMGTELNTRTKVSTHLSFPYKLVCEVLHFLARAAD